MYEAMDKVVKDYPYFGPDKTIRETGDEEQEETGEILIENDRRKILVFYPGRDHNDRNRANDNAIGTKRYPECPFKQLHVYEPAMDLGEAQPGLVIADIELEGEYKPNNVSGAFYGLVSAREGLVKSHNVTTVKLYQEILNKNPAKDYLMKMGYSN